jgi:transposase-like protein
MTTGSRLGYNRCEATALAVGSIEGNKMIVMCPQCIACNPILTKPDRSGGELRVTQQFQCHKCKSIFSLEIKRLHNGQETNETCNKTVVNYEKIPMRCKLNKNHEGGCNPYAADGVHSVTL